eukprot:TRINITY_DN93968_c0_g1_i1.p1 TRINITY_DN93968_c0_g1~~TRINITY_DN93968_c0_g1_i1.p1  ORF type:complete len:787 (-),score=56.93 TRINITY_DN93968_c0_g1_i1:59-2419(-)
MQSTLPVPASGRTAAEKVFQNGDTYRGEWENGKMEGYGTYLYANGTKYDGLFHDNAKEGFGIMQCTNGARYEGEWMQNFRHGNGTHHFANGDTYSGTWFQDREHGRGVLQRADASKIYGEWIAGVLQTILSGPGASPSRKLPASPESSPPRPAYPPPQPSATPQNTSHAPDRTPASPKAALPVGTRKHAQLRVVVTRGHQLAASNATRGLSVELHLAGQRCRTRLARGMDQPTSPVWDEEFHFTVVVARVNGLPGLVCRDSMRLEVLDGNRRSLATASIPLDRLQENVLQDFVVVLPSGGSVTLQLEPIDFGVVLAVPSPRRAGNASPRRYQPPPSPSHLTPGRTRPADTGAGWALPKGDSWDGRFLNGLPHGQGIYTSEEGGFRYEGEMAAGERSGRGILIEAGGRYEGTWLRNGRDGEGTQVYADGSQYRGEWLRDQRNGFGTHHSPLGDWYSGFWKADAMQGMGTMFYSDGSKYKGAYVTNRRHGHGSYYNAGTGDIFVGSWKNDLRHGWGTLLSPQFRYDGEWREDRRHGRGVLRDTTGEAAVTYHNGVLTHRRPQSPTDTLPLGRPPPSPGNSPLRAPSPVESTVTYISAAPGSPSASTVMPEPDDGSFSEMYQEYWRTLEEIDTMPFSAPTDNATPATTVPRAGQRRMSGSAGFDTRVRQDRAYPIATGGVSGVRTRRPSAGAAPTPGRTSGRVPPATPLTPGGSRGQGPGTSRTQRTPHAVEVPTPRRQVPPIPTPEVKRALFTPAEVHPAAFEQTPWRDEDGARYYGTPATRRPAFRN